jgi:hypothetical protein
MIYYGNWRYQTKIENGIGFIILECCENNEWITKSKIDCGKPRRPTKKEDEEFKKMLEEFNGGPERNGPILTPEIIDKKYRYYNEKY